MSVRSEWVTLTVDDGTTLRAWVARPESQLPKRGLLVFQEAFGVNAHIRDVTERFACEGYLAIAKAEPVRCQVIDGTREPDAIFAEIWAQVERRMLAKPR